MGKVPEVGRGNFIFELWWECCFEIVLGFGVRIIGPVGYGSQNLDVVGFSKGSRG